MLGVGDQHQEAHDDGDVEQQEDRLDVLVGLGREGVERTADQVGGERPPRVALRVRAGVELGAAQEQERDHHRCDHPEDDPGRADVRPVEPRLAFETGGGVAQPDDREGQQPREDRDGEEVLDETDSGPVPEQRDVEVAIEQCAERLDDGQHEDRETPEGEGVCEPGDRPGQQLPLSADLTDLTPQALTRPVEPAGSRLALADQPEQPVEPASSHRESDNGDHSADSKSHTSSSYSYRRWERIATHR